MIEQARGLNPSALEAIAGLERRALAADGGRLKLEWGTLRNRGTDEVRDLLWWDNGRLVGFLGIYGSGRRRFELTGMVDPEVRRRGIGGALFDTALAVLAAHRLERLLIIVPRASAAGQSFARSRGLTYEHSEHGLRLTERPGGTPAEPGIELRQSTVEDIPLLSALFRDGFDDDGHVDPDRLATDRSRTLMIELRGQVAGTIAVTRDGQRSAIHGFVVNRDLRGRGIGREALRRVCQDEFHAGATHVDLEVEVENDLALGLYTSLGFEPLATDDYYELSLP